MIKKDLILGSAQFGGSNGFNPKKSSISIDEIVKIIDKAKDFNINTIDTAKNYGNAEKILGDYGVNKFNVITKLTIPEISDDAIDDWILNQCVNSKEKLKLDNLYGVLVHNCRNLSQKTRELVYIKLLHLKQVGLINKIGVSIYDPSELEKIEMIDHLDLVQAPINVLDRRLENSGWLKKLHLANIEIHARSVFLQGLLLLIRNQIPSKFSKWSPIWDEWSSFLLRHNMSPIAACLSYPASLEEISGIVIGVESMENLIEVYNHSMNVDTINMFRSSSNIFPDRALIDPFNWAYLE